MAQCPYFFEINAAARTRILIRELTKLRGVVQWPTRSVAARRSPLHFSQNYGEYAFAIARRYRFANPRSKKRFEGARTNNTILLPNSGIAVPPAVRSSFKNDQNDQQRYRLMPNTPNTDMAGLASRTHIDSGSCNENQKRLVQLTLIEVQVWSEASVERIQVDPQNPDDGLSLRRCFGDVEMTEVMKVVLKRRYQSVISEVERLAAGRVLLTCAEVSWERCRLGGRRLLMDSYSRINTLILCPRFFGSEDVFRIQIFIGELLKMHLNDLPPVYGNTNDALQLASSFGIFSRSKSKNKMF